MSNYLVVYDITGIQSYIFKTRKVKEISGASLIIRNFLNDVIKEEAVGKIDNNWAKANCDYDYGNTKADFLNHLNQSGFNIEYAFEGGGNLLIFFHGSENELKEFNNKIQLRFLKETGGLMLAFSYEEIKENDLIEIDNKKREKQFDDYRKEVLKKLKDVKTRMPRNNSIAINPIMKLDPVYGNPIIAENNIEKISNGTEEVSYDSYFKLKYLAKCRKENDKKEFDFINVEEIDKLLDPDNSSKNMIAVIHIDGNDLGSMINNYISSVKKSISFDNFVDWLKVSRELSEKIDYVFKEKVINSPKIKGKIKMILNSGDDITFICNAKDALYIVEDIIKLISSESLYPKDISCDNKEILKAENKFSACAGICYCHPHFPFYRAYEIAEELCSNAKAKSKTYRIPTRLNSIGRPTSWFDFEIVQSGILKSINEIRAKNSNLYLRPYSFDKINSIDYLNTYDSFINNLKLFKNVDDKDIARSNAKEIRNKYELSEIDTKILFKKLKSRASDKSSIDYDNPYTDDDKAKYYDAVSLFDLYKVGE